MSKLLVSNAAKTAMRSKASGAFERVIAASEYESTRNKAITNPDINNLGFGVYITPVISSMRKPLRLDLALGDGISLSLLYNRGQVIIENKQVEHIMKLSPETPNGYDTSRGEYNLIESRYVPELAILRDNLLVGLVSKAYLREFKDIKPENATLLAAALSNSQEIYSFRSDTDLGRAFLDGCANPSEHMLLLEKMLGIDLAGLSYYGRLAYWIGRAIFSAKDKEELFKLGHIALAAAVDKSLYGLYIYTNGIIIEEHSDYPRSVSVLLDGQVSLTHNQECNVYTSNEEYSWEPIELLAGQTVYDLVPELRRLGIIGSYSDSLISYPRGLLSNISSQFLSRIGQIIKEKDWL